MKKFLKYILIFCSPMVLFVLTYVCTDPFKVLWHYDVYYDTTSIYPINTPLVSTMTYVNQREKYHYDSFIFENSRSLFYDVNDWKTHIDPQSSCLHFWTSGGYIKSWHDKVRFIDENHDTIKNALCVLDHRMLSVLENKTFWHGIEPPILDHNSNWFDFQSSHFKAFCDYHFILAVIDYKIFGEYRGYMKEYLANPKTKRENYDIITNERRRPDAEEKIAAGTYYDAEHMKPFQNVQKPERFLRIF